MQMFEVTVLGEDMHTEIRKNILFAEDEEDALDQVQAELEQKKIPYGVCQACEME